MFILIIFFNHSSIILLRSPQEIFLSCYLFHCCSKTHSRVSGWITVVCLGNIGNSSSAAKPEFPDCICVDGPVK